MSLVVGRKSGRVWGSRFGLYKGTEKEYGNYYSILGLYKDNGKENENYHAIGVCKGATIRIIPYFPTSNQ